MQDYKIQCKKGQGTYSIVYQVTKRSGPSYQKYALKIMKNPYQNIQKIKKDKQIKALHMFNNHQNIIKMIDVLYDEKTQKWALVFQLMDSNLYEYYKNKKNSGAGLNLQKIRGIVHDILTAVSFIHRKGIFHRDIKPENVLVKADKIFKLADFGSCKNFMSEQPYTQYISTRWYRAPECLMTDGYYSQKMDVWSVGCILFELYALFPLFPGKSEADQISTIFSILGTPNKQLLKKFQLRASHMKFNFEQIQGIGLQTLINDAPLEMLDLLYKMLKIDPDQRITIEEALNHHFFHSVNQLKKYQNKIISKIIEQKSMEHKESILPPIAKNKKI